ncbi:hypothetical protein ACN4EK_08880 [Pantanalinema rosaneae CENA516]|uniref:hypothetical protein n=1 Tax=Pantanalinema rosaneae TaxID=1620701 RepID=UPI003D6EB8D1
MNQQHPELRDEVHKIAEDAYQRHLISGYGDSEYADQYQIVWQGKPRHLSLTAARSLLNALLQEQ